MHQLRTASCNSNPKINMDCKSSSGDLVSILGNFLNSEDTEGLEQCLGRMRHLCYLRKARQAFRGGTVYINLEVLQHYTNIPIHTYRE